VTGHYSAVAVSLRLLGDYGEKVTLTRELLEGTGSKESSDGQANAAACRSTHATSFGVAPDELRVVPAHIPFFPYMPRDVAERRRVLGLFHCER
jgi:hypothetical protein